MVFLCFMPRTGFVIFSYILQQIHFMKTIFLLCTVCILVSCSNPGSDSSKQLSGSDSLVINFNTPQTDNIEKTMTTTESKAIKKLMNYVDGKTAGAYKCGYDGNLMFYKKRILLGDVSFNYSGPVFRIGVTRQ